MWFFQENVKNPISDCFKSKKLTKNLENGKKMGFDKEKVQKYHFFVISC